MSRTPHRRVILDMDSSESPVHGEQEGAIVQRSLWEHVLSPFVRSSTSSVTARALCSVQGTYIARTGGVMYWIRSCPATEECAGTFAPMPHSPSRTIYEYLEERRVFYAIRLPSNKCAAIRDRSTADTTCGEVRQKRPVILYDDFCVSCRSWDRARRVVAKVEWHRGELFPRVGFIVTNMTAGPEGVVRFYIW